MFICICISSEPMYVSEVQRAGGGGEADSGRWVVTTVPPVVNIQSSKSSRQYTQYIQRSSFKIQKYKTHIQTGRQTDRQTGRPCSTNSCQYTIYRVYIQRTNTTIQDRHENWQTGHLPTYDVHDVYQYIVYP